MDILIITGGSAVSSKFDEEGYIFGNEKGKRFGVGMC